jgi:hypothetical protein
MRAELEQLLHQTLHALQVKDSDAHLIVDWIKDEDMAERAKCVQEKAELRAAWLLRAAGMGAIGFVAGAVASMMLYVYGIA